MRFIPALCLSLTLLATSAVAAPLEEPTASIPAGATPEQVVKAIKRAVIGRKMTITSEAPGRIDVTHRARGHGAQFAAVYTATEVRFVYVGSQDLDYEVENGRREIHRNYNRWVNNIAKDFEVFLKQEQL